ncbi:TfoX/Sxy family protein [Cronobacter dublinensis]|uniref:TfoX/Sxy family protein n=1 Tax=Cronobacter dublinensis TaxID=413497 RepID=UPI0014126B21|nr:TfoX/Sxy family protein [Cronobacter dublinensis]EGT4357601.1 TfoX-like protein [Cronobacter dublinensis]MDI6475652.1 TfoX/Sxy family protein [Cronobacter dublinensis]NHV88926.1 TfoX/Sxy family protein [Cronobacter dublinensis]
MNVSPEYITFVVDQLAPLGGAQTRRMFGCVALFQGGRMFALVDGDAQVYIKADEQNRAQFIAAGFAPFTYVTTRRSGGQQAVALGYYRLPEELVEDNDEFLRWAREGLAAAARAPVKKPRKTARKAREIVKTNDKKYI